MLSLNQARYLTQAVTPDEYDAAAARSPEMCPLRYLGDTRSGRQVYMNRPPFGIRTSIGEKKKLRSVARRWACEGKSGGTHGS